MLDVHNHYDITFDVSGRNRAEFEEWLSDDAVGWLNQDAIATFDVFQNETGLSPEFKFVFGFETLEDWTAFVNSDDHEAAMESFETFADNREAILWQRGSVKLDETTDDLVNDGGHTDRTDSQCDEQTVMIQ